MRGKAPVATDNVPGSDVSTDSCLAAPHPSLSVTLWAPWPD